MKKLLMFFAALLPCVLGASQEFTLVTRAEYSSTEDGHLGNSSIYALLDGNITEKLSYSVETHLLSSTPGDLYTNTWHSDAVNWLDWANLTYDFGPVQVTLGKNYMLTGTFEDQGYDFDNYYEKASLNWLGYGDVSPVALNNIYLWGGSVNANIGESGFIAAQVASSPYNVRPFGDGLLAYSLFFGKNNEEEGWFNAIGSFNFVKTDLGDFRKMQFLSAQTRFDNLTLTLEEGYAFSAGNNISLNFNAKYNFNEKWMATAFAGYESGLIGPDADRKHAGVLVNWYPIESLRAHAVASYDSLFGGFLFNIGLTWKLTL